MGTEVVVVGSEVNSEQSTVYEVVSGDFLVWNSLSSLSRTPIVLDDLFDDE